MDDEIKSPLLKSAQLTSERDALCRNIKFLEQQKEDNQQEIEKMKQEVDKLTKEIIEIQRAEEHGKRP